ncbi:MAG: GNAT family N-acetyltransferase [Thermoplasmata archaeon]
MKLTFKLPRGYHWIKKSDVRFEIISGNRTMDSYSLERFYEDSLRQDTFVSLRKVKGKPIGIIELTFHKRKVEGIDDNPDFYEYSLVVELLSVDKSYQGTGIGTDLMALAENIAHSLNAYKILLEAVEDKVNFYKKLGYYVKGPKYIDADWGTLVPMERIISSM